MKADSIFRTGVIAIVGRPNVGKSTLLNRIMGCHLSIVTPKAQTTRDEVRGIYNSNEGQVIFLDTPGIHRAKEGGINAFMMGQASRSLEAPDLIWYLIEPQYQLKRESEVLQLISERAAHSGTAAPIFLILNKSDLPLKVSLEPLMQKIEESGLKLAGQYSVSARNGLGMEALMASTWQRIPLGPALYPVDQEEMSDRPMRFFVAEAIRKQIFLLMGDEIPYSCAVEISKFNEKSHPKRIEAVIHVERESQKGMVIGAGGKKIKAIGQSARQQIEELMGEKVFLGLKVQSNPDWTRNADALKKLGYHLPTRKVGHRGTAHA